MSILIEAKYRLESALPPARIGQYLRLWTTNSMRRSTPKERKLRIAAAQALSKIPGQSFPKVAYRVFELNTSKTKSWIEFAAALHAQYPESYSGTFRGAVNFFKDASGGYHDWSHSKEVILAVELPPSAWMFSLPSLFPTLPKEEQNAEDDAGFSLKEYLYQQEVVAKPGSMRAAMKAGIVSLVAYTGSAADRLIRLPKPLRIVL